MSGAGVRKGVLELVVPDKEKVLGALGVAEELGVVEGDAPCDSEAVGEADTVPLGVPLPLEVGVSVLVPVGDSVADTLGLCVELGVMDGEAPFVNEGVGLKLAVEDSVTLEVGVGVGVGVEEDVGVGVDKVDTEPVPE